MKKICQMLAISMLFIPCAFSQNESDVLRYSQLSFGGTARYLSMGGAFGALGADASSLSTNPAGIAMYRKSELTFTPSFTSTLTESQYYGMSADRSKFNMNINNFALILSSRNGGEDKQTGWIYANFGVGYNRLANFNRKMLIQGDNPNSSLLDVFVDQANGTDAYDLEDNYAFGAYPAFYAYLIDTIPGSSTSYYSQLPYGGERQMKNVRSRGGAGETVISFGGNYSNKLYLGGTVGLTTIRYNEKATHEEVDEQDTIPMFDQFRLEENYSIKGKGFNLKMGAIYRVTDWMRLGIAVHSPSFYNINDKYDSEIFAVNDTGRTFEYSSPQGEYDYNITTPFRAIGSVAFIIGKQGLISADYEFVDYSDAYLDSEFESYVDANNAIENNFTAANNLRVGGEIKLDPFSLRAGAAYYSSPFVSGFNTDASRMSYSAGFGIKEHGYFLDFAYVLTKWSENYYLYDRSFNVEPAKLDITSSHVAVTFGVTF